MPVSPALLDELLHAMQEQNALKSYRAASRLEQLKPEMSDEQRVQYEVSLASASHHRQEVDQAAEKAKAELRGESASDDQWP